MKEHSQKCNSTQVTQVHMHSTEAAPCQTADASTTLAAGSTQN